MEKYRSCQNIYKSNEKNSILMKPKAKMAQEKEFYSKMCVAGSIKFVVEEDVNLSEKDKFSCNLATILARDKEVVAVNLKLLPNKCKVYIAKNTDWIKKDYEYVNKIKEILINVSKDAPMTFKEASERADIKKLIHTIMAYCHSKFRYRLDKLKKDVTGNEEKIYIKSFLDYAKTEIHGDIFKTQTLYLGFVVIIIIR
ncbi:hypothetical protein C2G38_309576 [Gigaspora rosea]|uniref:Uncharacterized protein n=1 Tax=Gigaspora rosea TaxID=44941 RepID=A0A397UJH8_9GLOM|nr:hypothetical protein C2G38_309576 [Gigaspora rosea]